MLDADGTPLNLARAAGTPQARAHSLVVRITHWVNAFAVIAMILSGWRIYNASPLFDFRFPPGFTLGGWLAGALAWHFAAMWLLVVNGAVYLAYGFLSGHFLRDIPPPRPLSVWRDLRLALAGRLRRAPGRYNAVQRLFYIAAMILVTLAVVSGLAVWKPVQLQEIAALLGGYETARRVHFFAMAGIVAFLVLHVALAVAARGALRGMVTGRAEFEP